ncbi:MAG TPA: hypothetical protein VNJ08_09555 [Bacteriovoracaceae bacterium]|nr:hypothetical protein [Bacteriovoracaceae bacterium]
MTPQEKTAQFLSIASQFKLGHLVTEGFHPKTLNLSGLVKTDVGAALTLLQAVDHDALDIMKSKEQVLWELATKVKETLDAGHKVFMCGCGATGRLSLVLETLYRQQFSTAENVFSFMAGGDYALIKSVESFEDRVDYGERQLKDLGFGKHDLLIASTEGGETPFVIGATNAATVISDRAPYFLYCNPDELLMNIQRSKEVIQNPRIKKINLTVGPMAISGSTRMQASTVLMLAIGVGLLYRHETQKQFGNFYQDFLIKLNQVSYKEMAPLTLAEAKLYEVGKHLNYLADQRLAISILTDTTERSPTFSLKGFENKLEASNHHSLSYLFLPDGETSGHAWSELLYRSPRALEWEELDGRIGITKVLGFDISGQGLKNRSSRTATENFSIDIIKGKTCFKCMAHEVIYDLGDEPLLNHLGVKMLLNAHSTLIMGLLGRYEGNVMTYVRPSNNKLIDRASRYILQLLDQQGTHASYEQVVEMIFEEIDNFEERPVVLKVLDRFK